MRDSAGYKRVRACRVCRGSSFEKVLDLGKTPLANAFLTEVAGRERFFPLALQLCRTCSLVQLQEVVDPDLMFKNYPYRTSSSKTIPAHYQELASELTERFLHQGRPRVYEIGSNDGTLLLALRNAGANPIGIEPAGNLARLANGRGLHTIHGYFGSKLAQDLLGRFGPGEAIIANNVLAHVDQVHDLLAGVATLLTDGGLFVFEVPYVGDLVQNVEYDTIYHEHLSYFSVKPAVRLLRNHGLGLVDFRRLEVHGGSMRIVARKGRAALNPGPLLAAERRWGLYDTGTYRYFGQRVRYQVSVLKDLIKSLKKNGERIIGYGAPAKGNTLLNVCGIDSSLLEYVTDSTPEKQGKYTPGTHIPVRSPSVLKDDHPGYALMLAWNYLPEILQNERNFHGRFIVPIPSPRVLPKSGR